MTALLEYIEVLLVFSLLDRLIAIYPATHWLYSKGPVEISRCGGDIYLIFPYN